MSNEEIIRAFHLMWDNFPEAVMITQKSREVVANATRQSRRASRKFALTRAISARLMAIRFRFPKSRNGLFILALVMRSSIRKSTAPRRKRRKVFTA